MGFDTKVFGERLKELRLEKKLTTVPLGEALGVSDAIISRWETGLSIPLADKIYVIAKYFKVSADYLIGLED
jgi:transcriptional regulator with XRE-family HTH domain